MPAVLPSRIAAVLGAFLLCAPLAGAQVISASFSPNPAPPGVPVTVTGTDATGGGLALACPCCWYEIHAGSPTGPVVSLGIFCPSVIVPVGPNGNFAFTWNQKDDTGSFVPPGQYWFVLKAWDPGFTSISQDFFCLSIQGPSEPALRNTSPAQVGMPLGLEIDAPVQTGAFYLTVASFTSNNPLPNPAGGLTCIDFDILFQISLAPGTPGVFDNFKGFLDGSGKSSGMSLNLPSIPSLAHQPLKLQSFLLAGPSIVSTSGLSLTIAP